MCECCSGVVCLLMGGRYTGAIGKAGVEAGHGPEYRSLIMASQLELGLYTGCTLIYRDQKIPFYQQSWNLSKVAFYSNLKE